jgi:O-methyltransferase
MTNPLKRFVLRLLEERGYVLLKKHDYADLSARAHSAPTAAPPSAPAPQPPTPAPVAALPATPPPTEFGDFVGPGSREEPKRFLERARAIIGPLPGHAPAVYAAMHYVTKASIPGDILDCGEGTPTTLALAAAALSRLGNVRHRLVLFDVTANPMHRPETELPLWGSDRDYFLAPIEGAGGSRTRARALPAELLATGYPAEKIEVARYPDDAIDLTRPIAYLNLTSETYEANRAAIRALIPRVSAGGVIAVEGNEELRPSQPGCVQHQLDAVKETLAQRGIELLFWQATDAYRMAVKP